MALSVKPFHITTATLLIVHSQFPGKTINVSSITVTVIKRIPVAALTRTELCPGPSNDPNSTD